MKAFEIDRNSWHYKLNKKFFNNYEPWMEGWEARHADFCSYWRATFFRMMWIAILAFLAMLALTGFGFAVYSDPIAVLWGMFFIASVFGFAGFLIWVSRKIEDARRGEKAPPGLIKTKYLSWKGRYCPSVEYKAND